MSIIIDSGPLVAVLNKRDHNHEFAIGYARNDLQETGFEIIEEVKSFDEDSRGQRYWMIIAERSIREEQEIFCHRSACGRRSSSQINTDKLSNSVFTCGKTLYMLTRDNSNQPCRG